MSPLFEDLVSTFAGKSTLACSLGRELHTRGNLSYVLDGDNLRHGLNKNLGFSAESRAENIRRTGKCILAKYKYNNHEFSKLSISETCDANNLSKQCVAYLFTYDSID